VRAPVAVEAFIGCMAPAAGIWCLGKPGGGHSGGARVEPGAGRCGVVVSGWRYFGLGGGGVVGEKEIWGLS
jgi:hypothetical protein